MSNEANDWQWDRIQEVVLDLNLADEITKCYPYPHEGWARFVEGLKNGQPVKFEVFYDRDLCEWRCERRELEKE